MKIRRTHAGLSWLVGLAAVSATLLPGAQSARGTALAQCGVPVTADNVQKPTHTTPTTTAAKEDHPEKNKLPQSVPDTWKAIQAGRVLLEQVVAENRLGEVHQVAFWIRDLVSELPKQSKLSKESSVRLADASTRVAQIASALDEAGDSGDKAGVTTQLTRLDGTLEIIEALYPDALTPALEYVCPMHPEVRQAEIGKCAKCGMHLAPDAMAMPEPKKHSGDHH